MEFLKEYEKRKEIDAIVWRSLPTVVGYWFWFGVTIYYWHFKLIKLDLAATIGLAVGIIIWLLSHLILGVFGIGLINTNLWDNFGCGCLAKIVALPLTPYIGILALIIWAYKVGSLGMPESILGLFIGWIDWFLLTYLDT